MNDAEASQAQSEREGYYDEPEPESPEDWAPVFFRTRTVARDPFGTLLYDSLDEPISTIWTSREDAERMLDALQVDDAWSWLTESGGSAHYSVVALYVAPF